MQYQASNLREGVLTGHEPRRVRDDCRKTGGPCGKPDCDMDWLQLDLTSAMTESRGIAGLTAVLRTASIACSSAADGTVAATQRRAARAVIRITGSDTMVNLVQVWAENYKEVCPTSAVTVLDRSCPIARPLYLYTARKATGQVKAFLDWVLAQEGQRIVRDLGFVPIPGP